MTANLEAAVLAIWPTISVVVFGVIAVMVVIGFVLLLGALRNAE